MTKKTFIKLAIIILSIIVVLPLLFFGAMAIYHEYNDSPKLFDKEECETIIEVPDSDLTVVAKHTSWLQSYIEFYYVDENGEHVSLPYVVFRASYNPFATGDYEVINNQDGTFTIRWSNHNNPIPPKDTWGEVTYDFPS